MNEQTPWKVIALVCGGLCIAILSFWFGVACNGTASENRAYLEVRRFQLAAVAAGVGYFDRDSQWTGRGGFHFGKPPILPMMERP